jgi:predicted chitinase
MEKQIRIVKKGEDNSNLLYWLSQTTKQRMADLENIRQLINLEKYGIRQRFQRVYTVTKRL